MVDNDKLYHLLEKIDNKVDKLSVEQGKQEIINLGNSEQLKTIRVDLNYHIKRTDILEKELTKLRGFFFYASLLMGIVGAVTTVISGIWGN